MKRNSTLNLVLVVLMFGILATTVLAQTENARMKAKEKANRTKCLNGKQAPIVTPIEISFDDPADFQNGSTGRMPLRLILKNAASGQTIAFDRALRDWVKPSFDNPHLTIFVTIDNLNDPIGENVSTELAAAPSADGNGIDVTLTYSSGAASNRVGPIKGAVIKGGCNRPCGSTNRTKQPGRPTFGNVTFTALDTEPVSCDEAAAKNYVGHITLIKQREMNAARRSPEIFLNSSQGTTAGNNSDF